MEIRDRILEAAKRVYAKHGFRGATTRRIADAAGVNEVTIFRLFGSKSALLEEAVRQSEARTTRPTHAELPDEPGDPEIELEAWARDHWRAMRDRDRTAAQAGQILKQAPTLTNEGA